MKSRGRPATTPIKFMNGFYLETTSFPPKLILAILPPALIIISIFLLPAGKKFLENASLSALTIIHITRILVETCLWFLFMHKTIPRLMTFEGRNFDILSGISAPFVWYYAFIKRTMSRKLLIAWNLFCLALVLNVVIHGILAAPSVFQKLAFDQPNVAVLYFPFIWLPAFVVPVVIFSHLVCLKHLFFKKDFFKA